MHKGAVQNDGALAGRNCAWISFVLGAAPMSDRTVYRPSGDTLIRFAEHPNVRSCGMRRTWKLIGQGSVFEIIEYDAKYENELMKLIEKEGDDWAIYWKEPNAALYRKSFEQSVTYLALADGEVCGYARSLKDALFIYVCDLLVNGTYRGQGLGFKLVNRLKADYPSHPVYVMSGNDGYYQSIGAIKEGSVYLV